MGIAGDHITVLGAGIGGLATAIALAHRGAAVEVLEQAPALTEVGAGLQISHNGWVVLAAMGVDLGRADAVPSSGTLLLDGLSGRPVHQVPPPAAGPTHYVHRADLLSLLETRARALGVNIVLGCGVDLIEEGDRAAELIREGGQSLRRDVVIAADGVRGVGRDFVAGPGHPPFSGQVAWRAVVPCAPESADPRAEVAMAPGAHIVTYPLRGGKLMNLVAIEERGDWQRESWREAGDPAELRSRFAAFKGRATETLARVETVHRWALHLHPVASRWHRGRVVLVGDAAHPTLPFLAQGACLALEDAWTIAACLNRAATPEEGFAAYEDARAARAWKVVGAAQANAWRFHLRGPARIAAQTALRLAGRWIAPDFDWVYGYDPVKAHP